MRRRGNWRLYNERIYISPRVKGVTMSNRKQGCATCNWRGGNIKCVFNYRPFLRLVKRYRAKSIGRKEFCEKWQKAQEGSVFWKGEKE